MRFTADPDGVAASGARLAELARIVAEVDVSAELRSLAPALPGSGVAAALPEVGSVWGMRLALLSTAIENDARALLAGASWYAASEDSVHWSLVTGTPIGVESAARAPAGGPLARAGGPSPQPGGAS